MYATTAPYNIEGEIVSKEIALNNTKYKWDHVTISKKQIANNTISISILDTVSGEPIPEYENISDEYMNLSSLSTAEYPAIKLKAEFISRGAYSPRFFEWAVYSREFSDISLDESSIYSDDDIVIQEYNNNISVKVYNTGGIGISAYLYLYANEEEEGNLVGMTQINVEAGQDTVHYFNWIPESPGEHRLIATIDEICPDDENQSNNILQRIFNVIPSEHTDLSVDENGIYSDGEVLKNEDNGISIEIYNLGEFLASAQLYLYDNEMNPGNLIGMVQVSVDAGSSETFLFNWIPDSSGEHTVIASIESIDPFDDDPSNNEARKSFNVTTILKTDLLIEEQGISSDGPVMLAKINSITIEIQNIGENGATAELSLYDNEKSIENRIGMSQISVGAGQTYTHVFNWIPSTSGLQSLVASVDVIDPIDSNLTNNVAQRAFYVIASDLAVDESSIYSKGDVVVGLKNTIYVVVYNLEIDSASADLYIYENERISGNLLGKLNIKVQGELFGIFVFNWNPSTEGDHKLIVSIEGVDPLDVDVRNNLAEKIFHVSEKKTVEEGGAAMPLPAFQFSVLVGCIAAGALLYRTT